MTTTGEQEAPAPTARFGVPQLDRVWDGIPEGARILFVNDPGIDGDPFLYQAARHHLAEGRDVVIVATDRPPASIARDLAATGIDLGQHDERLHFVDAYSPLFGLRSPTAISIPRPDDLETWGAVLNDVGERYPGAVLLIDAFSAVADQMGVDRFLQDLPAIVPAFASFRLTAAFFTAWPYHERLQRLMDQFEAVVGLHAVQERVVMGQSFAVARADWRENVDQRPRLYKPLGPDGVVVYIPKVVITGPFNAGKTTFVDAVSDTRTGVDRMGTTVALDHGSLLLEGLRVDVFGTPGQSRFDPILRVVAGQAFGIVLVVDSTKPDSVERAKEMLDLTWRRGLPVIVAANKQDLQGALSPKEIRQRMAAPEWVQVMACDARDRESARAVLKRLIDAIMGPRAATAGTVPLASRGGRP